MTDKVLRSYSQVQPIVGNTPAQLDFARYLLSLDAVVRLLNANQIGPLTNAANDIAAAAAGVAINGLYRNGNAVQIRLT